MEREALDSIVIIMRQKYNMDISVYKYGFLLKSVEKRRRLIGYNPIEYCLYLENDINEAEFLFQSMIISHSKFFREPITYELLEQYVLPNIVSGKNISSEIRIWSAGCACGEEPYSLAILTSEAIQASTNKGIRFRIIATDISKEAIAVAQAGIYDESSMHEVKLKYWNKHFTNHHSNYIIDPQLKKHVEFSHYNLLDPKTTAPPDSIFGDFDLIICSNLLIYYNIDAQQVILKKLKQALSPNGYLVTSETEKALIESTEGLEIVSVPIAIFKNNKRNNR